VPTSTLALVSLLGLGGWTCLCLLVCCLVIAKRVPSLASMSRLRLRLCATLALTRPLLVVPLYLVGLAVPVSGGLLVVAAVIGLTQGVLGFYLMPLLRRHKQEGLLRLLKQRAVVLLAAQQVVSVVVALLSLFLGVTVLAVYGLCQQDLVVMPQHSNPLAVFACASVVPVVPAVVLETLGNTQLTLALWLALETAVFLVAVAVAVVRSQGRPSAAKVHPMHRSTSTAALAQAAMGADSTAELQMEPVEG